MTDRPFFSATTATRLLTIDRRGQATEKLLWPDTYVIRRTNRPGGWDTGTPEHVTDVESGICKIMAGGSGSGDIAEAVIVNLTPYTVRLPADTTLNPDTDMIVINGREFLVNDMTRGGENRRIVEASLSERDGGDS